METNPEKEGNNTGKKESSDQVEKELRKEDREVSSQTYTSCSFAIFSLGTQNMLSVSYLNFLFIYIGKGGRRVEFISVLGVTVSGKQ